MLKKLLATGLVVVSALVASAQDGPLGRAIKATQVILYPTNALSYSSNSVLQNVLVDLDNTLELHGSELDSHEEAIAVLQGSQISIVQGGTTVAGGAIVKDGNVYTIFFNTGGGTGSGGTGGSTAPPGSIMPWAADDPPTGWLLCDGTAYATNTYPDLFSTIGWRYSASASENFNVPDYRGVALVGVAGDRVTDPLAYATNRTASGVGGTYANAGSYQSYTLCTTNSTGVVARLPNVYVNWAIKHSNDTTNFLQSAVAYEGSSFSVSTTNGVLYISYPASVEGGSTDWGWPWTVSSSGGDTGALAASTTNRTIVAYYSDGDASSGKSPVLQGYLVGPDGTQYLITYTRNQSSNPYCDGNATYSITYDCPATYGYRVRVVDWRSGSTFVVRCCYKP